MVTNDSSRTVVGLLRWAAFGVLLGRAWQYLRWDAPFRAFFWDENLLAGLLATLGVTWSDWLNSPAAGRGIQYLIYGFGILYLLAAGAALAIGRRTGEPTVSNGHGPAAADRWLRVLLLLASGGLLILALLYWKERAYQLGQLIEYSLQVAAPVFLLWGIRGPNQRQWWFVRLAIALTFIGHGLYAVGYYPRPGHFLQMTMVGLGVGQESAATILTAAGWLDFLAASLVLLPQRRLVRIGLYYCVVWGLLTTLARVWSNGQVYGLDSLLNRWVWESLYRIPHFLVPLATLYGWKRTAAR
jgi:hypothetical protein